MLLDRAATLATKINAFQKLKNSADETEQFNTRAQQFQAASELMARLRVMLSCLNEAGVRVDFQPTDGLSFAEKARTLREAIKADPAKVNDPPFNIKFEFIDRLHGIAMAGQKAATIAWENHVDERADFGSEDVLSALVNVPQLRANVAKIREIRSEVSSSRAELPADPKVEVVRIDKLVNRHEEAWNTLDASDIPASVIAFIRTAASGSASLSAYTPEVQAWLESRELLGAFCVKLK